MVFMVPLPPLTSLKPEGRTGGQDADTLSVENLSDGSEQCLTGIESFGTRAVL